MFKLKNILLYKYLNLIDIIVLLVTLYYVIVLYLYIT
nr:MAG TPA: protein of unknown function (DUF4330) [Caudoviricetes sp.]